MPQCYIAIPNLLQGYWFWKSMNIVITKKSKNYMQIYEFEEVAHGKILSMKELKLLYEIFMHLALVSQNPSSDPT